MGRAALEWCGYAIWAPELRVRGVRWQGFVRWRYHKATHTHCIAFRKTAEPPRDDSVGTEGARAQLWIPADRVRV